MDSAGPCRFNTLLPRSFPHILEDIFFHLDYESFKTCFEVSNAWKELLNSESVQKKAKDVFSVEIAQDEVKLVRASGEGNTEIIIRLLSTNMLDLNCDCQLIDPEDGYHHKSTPLYEAAEKGHTDVVQLLLDRGAQPDISTDYGNTPLKLAAEMGCTEVVKLLIDGGANPNKTNEEKFTPLHEAAREGHKDIVQLLVDSGANPNMADVYYKNTPLHEAVREGHKDVVQMLLDGGADVNLEDKDEETPFSLAFAEHEDVEQLLLEKGATPHKEYYERELWKAIEKGDANEVKRLLSKGVDVNCEVPDHSAPLHMAVRTGHKGIVHLLLDRGADPNMTDGEEGEEAESPLKIALEDGNKDLARILLDAGAEPDDEDKEQIARWDSDSDSEDKELIGQHSDSVTDDDSRSESDPLGKGKSQSLITKYFVRR